MLGLPVSGGLHDTPLSVPPFLTSLFSADLLAWRGQGTPSLFLPNDSVYLCSGHDVYI